MMRQRHNMTGFVSNQKDKCGHGSAPKRNLKQQPSILLENPLSSTRETSEQVSIPVFGSMNTINTTNLNFKITLNCKCNRLTNWHYQTQTAGNLFS